MRYNECFTIKWVEYLSPTEWHGTVTLQFIDVDRWLVEPAECRLDPDVIAGWARRIEEGTSIPPPVGSLTEKGTYYLHDGNHRFAAIAQTTKEIEQIRIGMVTPIKGYKFERVHRKTYSTYALSTTPRRALVTTASAWLVCALVVSVAAALGATILVSALIVVSVIWTARRAGAIAGMLSAAIGIIAMAYFVLPPTFSLRVNGWAEFAELVFFPLPALWIARSLTTGKANVQSSGIGALRSWMISRRTMNG